MKVLTTTADIPTPEPVIARSPRALLLAGLRHGRYPAVPAALTAALSALESVDILDLEVRSQAASGLGPFVGQLTSKALAGEALPTDFATAAHQAQQDADRQTAAAVAVAALRQALEQRLPGVVSDSLDGLFDGLRAQLEELLNELRTTVVALDELDVADPDAVAAASDDQRLALLDLGELRKRYGAVRMGQRQALEASDLVPPGTTIWSVNHNWEAVYATGVHEFAEVAKYGTPSPHLKPVDRLRAVAGRPDVWMPTVEELRDAWDRLHEPRTQTTSGSAA
jgi:hypothetical protein